MKIDPATGDEFDPRSATPLRAEDLFLPAIEEVVKHLARMAAESDYRYFIETGGKIPYTEPDTQDGTG